MHFNSSLSATNCPLPAGAAEQCWPSPRGCAPASWCFTQNTWKMLACITTEASRGEESRKALLAEMGTYSNERSGNQVLKKQLLSCQGSNINILETLHCSHLLYYLRSKVDSCFLLLGDEYRCNIPISSMLFKAVSETQEGLG